MARKFMIDYESGPYGAYFSREEFFILVHYAMRLNPILGEKFYFAGETEYIYRHEKNIPMEGLEYDESNTPYWNTVALSEVIKFIIDQLIPSLESETVDDMILILGGGKIYKRKLIRALHLSKDLA
ncbi:hypothetical protein HYN59_06240 [Flavobacterium album]|uniref:Uncharacterized protein n=1 Tax=Flavobacterium album TaxID=2175091 RepID=A0A2S1QWI1_9FLAO|nr:hypothetical protein [Flavobacterium album]AWH84744.1 hypothetical protein HYN59_06240 [Flavobacterium album]